jgi:hypothetical protein
MTQLGRRACYFDPYFEMIPRRVYAVAALLFRRPLQSGPSHLFSYERFFLRVDKFVGMMLGFFL